MEGIGSETYHFEENNDEAKSDKYRGQTKRRKEQKLKNETKKANEAKLKRRKETNETKHTTHEKNIYTGEVKFRSY